MLYHLLLPLQEYISGLNLFRYITFRAGAAAVTALLISFFVGPIIVRWLKRSGRIEEIRSDGPASHASKAGTPTMGGLIVLASLLGGTLLFARWDLAQTWLLVGATLWMGIVGFIDDWLKAKNGKTGLEERFKLGWQLGLGLIVGLYIYFNAGELSEQFLAHRTLTTLPFLKYHHLDLGLFGLGFLYVGVTAFILTGTSNAVNLTDGLDGLAIGLTGIMAVGFAVLSYVSGHIEFSRYLNIVYLPGSGEIAVYCSALVGAALGFLWFNAPPAQVYMGDTGALALGSGLATVAILIKKELFLLMLGGVMVMEVISVIMQRGWFKWTRRRYGAGRRLFKMAPIHHHFELLGWPESQVVVRFWIIGILLLFLTMTSFKVR